MNSMKRKPICVSFNQLKAWHFSTPTTWIIDGAKLPGSIVIRYTAEQTQLPVRRVKKLRKSTRR